MLWIVWFAACTDGASTDVVAEPAKPARQRQEVSAQPGNPALTGTEDCASLKIKNQSTRTLSARVSWSGHRGDAQDIGPSATEAFEPPPGDIRVVTAMGKAEVTNGTLHLASGQRLECVAVDGQLGLEGQRRGSCAAVDIPERCHGSY